MGAMSDAAKVGAVVIVVLAMVIGLAQLVQGNFLQRGKTYLVEVDFVDPQGVGRNMEITKAGAPVGWIKKPPSYSEDGARRNALIAIYKRVQLRSDEYFEIGQEGLIGEKYIEIKQEDPPDPEAHIVQPGEVMNGRRKPDFTDAAANISILVASVTDLIKEQNREGTLSNLPKRVEESIIQVNGLLSQIALLVGDSKGYVTGSLRNVESVSENFLEMSERLNEASKELAGMATDPAYREKLDRIMSNMDEVSASLNQLSSDLTDISSDPQVRQDIKDSIRLAKEVLEEGKAVAEKLQESLDKADTVMDDASSAIHTVEDTVTDAKSKLDKVSSVGEAIELRGGVSVRAVDRNDDRQLDNDDAYVGDMNVAVGYDDTYISLGADNIGEESDWNLLLGYGSLSGFSFRGGVYHGELGVGAAYYGDVDAEVTLYDTADPKLNAYGYIPITEAVNIVVGGEDLGNDPVATAGVSVEIE